MLTFIQNYFNKQNGIKLYKQAMLEGLSDNVIDNKEQKNLDDLCREYKLLDNDLFNTRKEAFAFMFNKLVDNHRITEDDKLHLETFLKNYNLTKEQVNFNQEAFNKYHSLGLIEEGKFPEVANNPVNIIYQKGEKLYWASSSKLMKFKHVTKRINYSGPRGSIRIMKGLSYRYGSYNFGVQSQEYLAVEDTGVFWLSNKRIGFKGLRKQFDFPYVKVRSFELSETGLNIAKEGRESYYMLQMNDYDVPCSIVSRILNT